MTKEEKIKYRRYMTLTTKVNIEKKELSPEEREEVISMRDGLGKNHEQMVRTAGKVLSEDMEK